MPAKAKESAQRDEIPTRRDLIRRSRYRTPYGEQVPEQSSSTRPVVTTVNIGASDPRRLANFYLELLGLEVAEQEPDWVLLRDPRGGVGLSFQRETPYERPVWPARPGAQQMMLHLEIRVDDLAAASARAEDCGATMAALQPQDDVRVYLDPDGHPFCLWLDS